MRHFVILACTLIFLQVMLIREAYSAPIKNDSKKAPNKKTAVTSSEPKKASKIVVKQKPQVAPSLKISTEIYSAALLAINRIDPSLYEIKVTKPHNFRYFYDDLGESKVLTVELDNFPKFLNFEKKLNDKIVTSVSIRKYGSAAQVFFKLNENFLGLPKVKASTNLLEVIFPNVIAPPPSKKSFKLEEKPAQAKSSHTPTLSLSPVLTVTPTVTSTPALRPEVKIEIRKPETTFEVEIPTPKPTPKDISIATILPKVNKVDKKSLPFALSHEIIEFMNSDHVIEKIDISNLTTSEIRLDIIPVKISNAGLDTETEADTHLIKTAPNFLKLKPNSSQEIEVKYRGLFLKDEQVYRLHFIPRVSLGSANVALPEMDQDEGEDNSYSLITGISIPILISGESASAKIKWQREKSRIIISNLGNASAYLHSAKKCQGSASNCEAIDLRRLYPGNNLAISVNSNEELIFYKRENEKEEKIVID